MCVCVLLLQRAAHVKTETAATVTSSDAAAPTPKRRGRAPGSLTGRPRVSAEELDVENTIISLLAQDRQTHGRRHRRGDCTCLLLAVVAVVVVVVALVVVVAVLVVVVVSGGD